MNFQLGGSDLHFDLRIFQIIRESVWLPYEVNSKTVGKQSPQVDMAGVVASTIAFLIRCIPILVAILGTISYFADFISGILTSNQVLSTYDFIIGTDQILKLIWFEMTRFQILYLQLEVGRQDAF